MRRPLSQRLSGKRRRVPDPQPRSAHPEPPSHPPRSPERPSRKPRLVAALSVVWALAVTGWFVYVDRAGTTAFPFLVSDQAAAAAEPAPSATPLDPSPSAEPDPENPYVEALAEAEGRVSDLQREVDRIRAEMVANDVVPASSLPVVSFSGPGYAPSALRKDFQSALVTPLAADADERGAVLVGVVVAIPAEDGEPFTYTALYLAADPLWSTFGRRGSPLPIWTSDCPEGC